MFSEIRSYMQRHSLSGRLRTPSAVPETSRSGSRPCFTADQSPSYSYRRLPRLRALGTSGRPSARLGTPILASGGGEMGGYIAVCQPKRPHRALPASKTLTSPKLIGPCPPFLIGECRFIFRGARALSSLACLGPADKEVAWI